MRTSGRVAVCALLSSLIGLSGCTAAPAASPPAGPTPAARSSPAPVPAPAVPTPDHVVIVVLENKDVDQILGDPGAPYLQSLAAR